MNRSFFNVILGGWGATDQASSSQNKEQKPTKSGNADDAAFLMKNASSVIIVPGYGMAVAQAQILHHKEHWLLQEVHSYVLAFFLPQDELHRIL